MARNPPLVSAVIEPNILHAGLLLTCLVGGGVGRAQAGPSSPPSVRTSAGGAAKTPLPEKPQVNLTLPDCGQVLEKQLTQKDSPSTQKDSAKPDRAPACSTDNVLTLVQQFPRTEVPAIDVNPTASPEEKAKAKAERTELQRAADLASKQALLACLKEYVKKTQCVEAACHMAYVLHDVARLQANPQSPPAPTAEELNYGTLCLSCVGSSPATKSERTLVEEWSVPPKRMKNDLYYGLGGALLGLGGASLAAGIGLMFLHNKPNGDMSCLSGGLPSQCLNNFVPHILVTLGIGVAGGVAGGLLVGHGCKQCARHAKENFKLAPPGGGGQ